MNEFEEAEPSQAYKPPNFKVLHRSELVAKNTADFFDIVG